MATKRTFTKTVCADVNDKSLHTSSPGAIQILTRTMVLDRILIKDKS